MDSFKDYKSLEDTIVEWMDRGDIRPRVPEFIRLCTIDITRDLRIPTMEQVAYVPVTADGSARVPLNMVELISINWLSYKYENGELKIDGKTPLNRSSLNEYQKHENEPIVDSPKSFSRVRGNYKVFPLPAVEKRLVGNTAINDTEVGLVEILYYALPAALKMDSADNWILDIAPDLYFYGAMMHANRYVKDFELAEYWSSKFEKSLKEVQGWAKRDEWSGGPIVVGEGYGV